MKDHSRKGYDSDLLFGTVLSATAGYATVSVAGVTHSNVLVAAGRELPVGDVATLLRDGRRLVALGSFTPVPPRTWLLLFLYDGDTAIPLGNLSAGGVTWDAAATSLPFGRAVAYKTHTQPGEVGTITRVSDGSAVTTFGSVVQKSLVPHLPTWTSEAGGAYPTSPTFLAPSYPSWAGAIPAQDAFFIHLSYATWLAPTAPAYFDAPDPSPTTSMVYPWAFAVQWTEVRGTRNVRAFAQIGGYPPIGETALFRTRWNYPTVGYPSAGTPIYQVSRSYPS